LKKIIPIFLFILISINHLNIIDALMQLSPTYHKENNKLNKTFTTEEENEKGKQNEDKGNNLENEKYLSKYHLSTFYMCKFTSKDYFTWFNTTLNKYPYHDKDTKPPKLA
jgi:hypothetical protein